MLRKIRERLKNRAAVFFLSAMLSIAPVGQASAQVDPVAAANWVTTNIQWLAHLAMQAAMYVELTLMNLGLSRIGAVVGTAAHMQSLVNERLAQAGQDGARNETRNRIAMEVAMAARVPENSTICPIQAAQNMEAMMENAVRRVAEADLSLIARACAGAGAVSVDKCKRELYQSACAAGFVSSDRYGQNVTDCPRNPNARSNEDMMANSLVADERLLVPVDAHITRLPDGILTFHDLTADELPFAAAYLFCHTLALPDSIPVYGTGAQPTEAARQAIIRDRYRSGRATNAATECIYELWSRASFPASGATAQPAGSGPSFRDIQLAACTRLRNGPRDTPPGLLLRDPKDYVERCQQNGLSLRAMEYVRYFGAATPENAGVTAASNGTASATQADVVQHDRELRRYTREQARERAEMVVRLQQAFDSRAPSLLTLSPPAPEVRSTPP